MTDTIDNWVLYPALRDRMITLVRSLSTGELERTVPLTPEWTVAEVVAHVCGLNADLVAGARQGLGSDERTSAQVSSRSHLSTDAVCDEWLGHDEAMQTIVAEVPLLEQRLAGDLLVHLHDVQHALGHEIVGDDEATVSAAHTYATLTPQRWFELAGVSAAIELDDGFRSGEDDAVVVLRCAPYDFIRSVTGRRSRSQVESLDWSEVVTDLIDHFSPYGPLRSQDAPV